MLGGKASKPFKALSVIRFLAHGEQSVATAVDQVVDPCH